MASLTERVNQLLRSPHTRQLAERAQQLARDPRTQRKIEALRARLNIKR